MGLINWHINAAAIICLLAVNISSFANCNDRMIESTPASRFELFGDEAKDLKTGLIWQRCPIGSSWDGAYCRDTEVRDYYTWAEALAFTNGAWRLPNIKELASIIETSCKPAINGTIFYGSDRSWSSSPDTEWFVDYDGYLLAWGIGALYIDFYNGEIKSGEKRFERFVVRLVRNEE